MRPHILRDDQWNRIRDSLPGRAGVTAADNRRFVDAVIHRYRTGISWRDLPAHSGDWNNTHRRHRGWAKRSVWASIFAVLATDADNEYAMIDSTILGSSPRTRAHQHSAGAQKKSATIKRPADAMLPGMEAKALLADKAYDAGQRVIELLAAAGQAAGSPRKAIGRTQASTTK